MKHLSAALRTMLVLSAVQARTLHGEAGAPAIAEAINLAGLRAPVEILVDRWGVPHIFARNEDDLFYAQGFNAARDRLFQIDLWRRRGLGQLSEVSGKAFVEQDRAARLFLYRGDMDREWRSYSSAGNTSAKRMAASFAHGINAFIDDLEAHPERMPWEFKHLGYKPARWAPEDIVRIRSHGLTRNLQSEVARARAACAGCLASDEFRVGLQPPWGTKVPEGLDPCLPRDILEVFQLATRSLRLSRETQASGAQGEVRLAAISEVAHGSDLFTDGSNNWVISPRRSATGRAILANDPHRAYSIPSIRYIAHLAAPGLNVIGAGEPILPGVSIGHNGTIAFGLTIFPIDQEDLYVYEVHPENPGLYRYREGWEPFRIVREEIRVKGSPPIIAELAFTRHGPVILVDPAKHRAFAVRSGWLEPGMSPYFCSVDSMRAKNFSAFRRAMNRWGAPTLNHVYADRTGNIGWIPRGLAPKRPNWDGLLPVPGDGRYEWDGFWSGDDLPAVYNPPEGWFATANQMNLPPDYPYRERRLGFEWTNPSRYERISEVLGELDKVSLEDSERLQNDIVSIPARRLIELLKTQAPNIVRPIAALELLRGWDGRESQDSPQAALFEVWQARHLRRAFLRAAAGKAVTEGASSADTRVMIQTLKNPSFRAADGTQVAGLGLMTATLEAAYAEMERLQGTDPKQWRWGGLHHNLIEHVLSDLVDEAGRKRINVGPLSKHGGEFTPNQSGYRVEDFRQTGGPSFRMVLDVGNWDNSRAVNHPGQSGDPESLHYRDLAPLWLEGKYFPLLYSRAAIERETELRIRLVPQASLHRR